MNVSTLIAPLARHLVLLALCALTAGTAAGQARPSSEGASVYTCVDAAGRRLTSDRPIAACLDREQRELGPNGVVRRVIGPSLTAVERETYDAQERQRQAAAMRVRDAQRADRALLQRYPNRAAHDAAREEAFGVSTAVTQAAEQRLKELAVEGKAIDDEMEFYVKDPSRAPRSLQRRRDDMNEQLAVQQKMIADQQTERARINARFDEELGRLQRMWGNTGGSTAQR